MAKGKKGFIHIYNLQQISKPWKVENWDIILETFSFYISVFYKYKSLFEKHYF